MRIALRTALTTVAAASLPVGLAGWGAMRLAEDALRARAESLHVSTASLIADAVGANVRARVRAVQLAGEAIDFDALDTEARLGALRLVFRQLDGASAVALFGRDGAQLAPAVFLGSGPDDKPDAALAGRPRLDREDLARFAAAIPFDAARSIGTAIGTPYSTPAGAAREAIAVRTRAGSVLAVELGLDDTRRLLAVPRLGANGRAWLVDLTGRTLVGVAEPVPPGGAADTTPPATAATGEGQAPAPASPTPLSPASLSNEALLSARAGRAASARLVSSAGTALLGAVAPVADLGCAVAVAEPADDALAAARAVGSRTLGWLVLALGLGGALGIAVTRALLRPIAALHAGAAALGRGELEHRVAGAERVDELGDLARAFNGMATEIARWNRELESRVEERTRALLEAQELLVRAQKLAAVGALGAGVAHEVNNPLAALVGRAQLLSLGEPEGSRRRAHADAILRDAERIRDVVERLRRVAEGDGELSLRPTDVHGVIEAALADVESPMRDANIEIVRELAPSMPMVNADANRLAEALAQLLANARRAMSGRGGRLTVSTAAPGGQLVVVRVSDTGCGIPQELHGRIFEPFFTTKDDWNAKGLGLPLVEKITTLHGGRVTVESAPGQGATFTLTLPTAATRALA